MATTRGNGQPATKEARQLIRRDFTSAIASLGESRVISRQLLQMAVGQFDPEFISLPRLYQMRRDPMIQMGLHYVKAPMLRATRTVECEEEKIAVGVEEIIAKAWSSYMKILLTSLDFGYQGGIKQFELGQIHSSYEDPETGEVKPVWDPNSNVKPVVLAKPIPLPPEFCSVKLDEGEFKGISTSLVDPSDTPGEDKVVPPEFSLWMANEFEESFHNYYGYPRTGYAYRYWWSYWFRFHMEDRHFEMDADPPLEVHYPPGSHTNPETGETKDHKTIALELGQDLRGGATVAWPSDVHIDEQGKMTTTPLWSAKFMEGGENLDAFRQSAEYLDVMKLRSVLVPEQALVEGKGGTSSRNVAASYADIFQDSLGQQAEDMAAYWNKYIIPQIVEANWGTDAPPVTLKLSIEDEDLTLVQELVKLAFTADPNALPINFDDLVKKANLPVYSAKEQEEREEALREQQEEERRARLQEARVARQLQGPPSAPANPQGPPAPPPARPPVPLSLAAQTATRTGAPDWARREGERRRRNTMALAERLEATAQDRYRDTFDLVAEYIELEGQSLSLGVTDWVENFVKGATRYVRDRTRHYRDRFKAEFASMFHAAGAAEASRLGLDMNNWDVGRDEVQDWAEQRSDFVNDSIDETVIRLHIAPWMSKALAKRHPETGIPSEYAMPYTEAHEIADELRAHFSEMPEWKARQIARTEARTGYNQAGIQIWDWAGITHVHAYDGLGGLTGQTDAECLARNGQRMSLAEAMAADKAEHPNGTLGFIPDTDGVDLNDLPGGTLRADAVRSASIYAVDADGLVLSQREVGNLLENRTQTVLAR